MAGQRRQRNGCGGGGEEEGREEEEDLYSILPPELLSSYSNQEEEPIVASPSIQGMHVQFEMRQSDLGQAWFHMRANRPAAELLLGGKPPGAFLVRPSSQRSCYALSYVTAAGKVKHDIIFSRYPGFSMAERSEEQVVYRSLSELISGVGLVKEELMVTEHDPNDDGQQELACMLGNSNTQLVECVRKLLMRSEEAMTELSWTLSVQEPTSTGALVGVGVGWGMQAVDIAACEKRTTVHHCFSQYVAPDLLPLSGSAAESVFKALARNKSLVGLTVRGYCSPVMHRVFCSNLVDGDILFLARSLVSNSCITAIDLSTNRIGDKGAFFLAAALKRNTSIRTLVLDRNFIHFEGIRHLALALQANHFIDHLSLAGQLEEDEITGSKKLSTDRRAISLIHQTSAVLRRKQELVGAAARSISFQGFRSRAAVERKLAGKKAGSYVFYLNSNVPNSLFVAYVCSTARTSDTRGHELASGGSSPSLSRAHLRSRSTESFSERLTIVHRHVFRHLMGYSLERPSGPLPSLAVACCWSIASVPRHKRTAEMLHMAATERSLFERIDHLVPLWGFLEEDKLEGGAPLAAASVYPTLSDMMAASKRWMRR